LSQLETSTWRGTERNGVWRNLVGPGSRAVHTAAERAKFEEGLVADLRLTAGRYPTDRRLGRLISELRAASPRFVDLWEKAELPDPRQQSRHKIIDHPDVGRIALDCDVLIVAGDDLRITVYTAEPGSGRREARPRDRPRHSGPRPLAPGRHRRGQERIQATSGQ